MSWLLSVEYIGKRCPILLVPNKPHPWCQVIEIEGDCQVVISQELIGLFNALLMNNLQLWGWDFIGFSLLDLFDRFLVVVAKVFHVNVNHDLRLLFLLIIAAIIESHFNFIIVIVPGVLLLLFRSTLLIVIVIIIVITSKLNLLFFLGFGAFLLITGFNF